MRLDDAVRLRDRRAREDVPRRDLVGLEERARRRVDLAAEHLPRARRAAAGAARVRQLAACSSVSSSSSVASRMKVSGGFSYTTSSPLSVFSVTVNVALFGSAGGAAAAGGAASAAPPRSPALRRPPPPRPPAPAPRRRRAPRRPAARRRRAAAAAGAAAGGRAERGARRHVAGRHRALALVAEEHVEAPAQLALGAPRALAVEHQLRFTSRSGSGAPPRRPARRPPAAAAAP